MDNKKILERKGELEQQMIQNVSKRQETMEIMKLAQKTIAQLREDELQLDGRYRELCGVLGLGETEEFNKALAAYNASKVETQKKIPDESSK